MNAGIKSITMICSTLLLVAACGGGGGGGGDVMTPPPVVTPPPNPNADNLNISNPTLTVFDNNEISPGDSLTLVWSDEFDGSQLDPETWYFESGDGSQYGIPGWGNNELQFYEPNSAQVRSGMLTIEAREEASNGFNYTSARIHTRDRFAFRYGRIEARIRLPGTQGLWPAFWMLPQDDQYGGWAASGEMDIMEAVNLGGAGGNTIHGTIHYGGSWPNNVFTGDSTVAPNDATAEFHIYAIEWDANEIRWYVDGVLYAMQKFLVLKWWRFPRTV